MPAKTVRKDGENAEIRRFAQSHLTLLVTAADESRQLAAGGYAFRMKLS